MKNILARIAKLESIKTGIKTLPFPFYVEETKEWIIKDYRVNPAILSKYDISKLSPQKAYDETYKWAAELIELFTRPPVPPRNIEDFID